MIHQVRAELCAALDHRGVTGESRWTWRRPYQDWTIEAQQAARPEIIAAFDAFWGTNPSRDQFAQATDGLVLFPEMLWIMVRPRDG